MRDDFSFDGITYRVETAYDELEGSWVVNFFRNSRLASARLYRAERSENEREEAGRAHSSESSILLLALQLRAKLAGTKDPQARMKLGYFLFVYQFYSEAEVELKAALAAFGDFAEALFHLGSVCHRQGKFNQAAACFEKAASLDSRYADYSNALGQVYLEEGRIEEAERALLAALETNPKYLDARLNLAQLYLDRAGRQGESYLARAEELLKESFAILHPQSPFPPIDPTIHYDSLCRTFLDLKAKCGSQVDKSNLRAWCYLYNLAFRSGPELLSRAQLERYIERLYLENRFGFADLSNFLGVAYLFYARFFLSAAEEVCREEKESLRLIKKLAGKQTVLLGGLEF
ncbi:MAG: tetratricopeptide repeat protein [candidate division Zixibacteria bacterium]|nr:tetratricopeptide repeat protein [candidate division Zixibacteria bacterium]MCI0595711.1 tetratricopeptide repeat protein [candidate division Zixibacteria bacterium]